MKFNKIVALIGVVCMGIGMIHTDAAFSLEEYTTLYEKLQRTDVIAVGTIVKKKITSDKTYNYFETNRVIYGNLAKPTIPVVTSQGRTSGVAEQPRYHVGEIYLVFLRRNENFRFNLFKKGTAYATVFFTPSTFYVPSTGAYRLNTAFHITLDAVEPLLDLKSESEHQKRIQKLLKMLKAENPYLVETAVIELKKEKVQEAIPDLIQVLRTGGWQARFNAIDALREMGGSEAITGIRAAIHDPSPYIRCRAAQTLAWMKVYEAEEDIINLFRNKEEDINVRTNIAFALGELGSTKALPYLEEALKENQKDFSPSFKDAVLMAINQIILRAGINKTFCHHFTSFSASSERSEGSRRLRFFAALRMTDESFNL